MAALSEQRELLNPYGERAKNDYVETFEHLKLKAIKAEKERAKEAKSTIPSDTPEIHLLPHNKIQLSPTQIVDIILNHFDFTIEELRDKSRKGHIVMVRTLIVFLINKYCPDEYGPLMVGKIINRDHSTTITALYRANNLIKTNDRKFIMHLEQVERKLIG